MAKIIYSWEVKDSYKDSSLANQLAKDLRFIQEDIKGKVISVNPSKDKYGSDSFIIIYEKEEDKD